MFFSMLSYIDRFCNIFLTLFWGFRCADTETLRCGRYTASLIHIPLPIKIHLNIFLGRFQQNLADIWFLDVLLSYSCKNPKFTKFDPLHRFWAVAPFGSAQVMYPFVRTGHIFVQQETCKIYMMRVFGDTDRSLLDYFLKNQVDVLKSFN